MLRHQVGLRSAFEAILGRIRISLDVHFSDSVHTGDGAETAAGIAVAAVHPIHVHGVAAPALKLWNGRAEASSPGIRVVDDLHARQGLEYRHRITAFYHN